MARWLLNNFVCGSLFVSSILFVSPACGQVTFETRGTYTTGQNPQYVAVGDVNGDLTPDVVIANTSSNSLSVLINKHDSTGYLKTPTTYTVGVAPSCVAIADLNNDTFVDLTATNFTSGSVSVLLGNGDGTFKASVSYNVLPPGITTAPSPTSIAIGDVNGDGCPDAVVSNSGLASVSVMLGNGKGGLTASTTVAVGKAPNAIALAQMTGDGFLDIVTCNKTDRNVSVLVGNGNGTFQAAKNARAGYVPYALVVQDFSGDGKADVAVCDNMSAASGINYLKGNGDGTLQTAVFIAGGTGPIAMSSGDYNADGRTDVSTVNTGTLDVSVYLNDGAGTFCKPIALVSGTSRLGIGGADLDEDGTTDIVLANAPSGATVLLNVTANISNFYIAPNTLLTGGSTVAYIGLSRVAPAGGVLVTLTNNRPDIAWIPANLTIPAGEKTGLFHISTTAPKSGVVTITASYGGITLPATLEVNPAPPGELKCDINGDGKVDVQDIVSVARVVGGLDPMK